MPTPWTRVPDCPLEDHNCYCTCFPRRTEEKKGSWIGLGVGPCLSHNSIDEPTCMRCSSGAPRIDRSPWISVIGAEQPSDRQPPRASAGPFRRPGRHS
nr:hypothetical protein CFP56_38975 [Quercus suber]